MGRELTRLGPSLIFRAVFSALVLLFHESPIMVSNTCHSDRRRAIRKRSAGRRKAKARVRLGTPAFPLQPKGYDPNTADAKKSG